MTALDDKLLPAVLNLATTLGKTTSVTTESLTYDPTTGLSSRSTSSHTNQKLLGLRPVSRRYLEEGLAEDGDSEGIWAASGLSFTPALGVRVTFGGKTYTTVVVREIHSGDSICAYQVVLRAA
mgnify:CR=1 FL=1